MGKKWKEKRCSFSACAHAPFVTEPSDRQSRVAEAGGAPYESSLRFNCSGWKESIARGDQMSNPAQR